MSFAGFNSSKLVKGRLQAALYFMRKKNRLRRADHDVGEVVFDPASILGIVGYYDLESLATFTQDEAGAMPVTAANQTAKRIIDTSGNGLHLTSATGMVVRGTPTGPNLLGDNGMFLADTNAIAGAGWTIGEGRATAVTSNAALTFPVEATAGKLYLIRYFVSTTAGSVQVNFGGANGVSRSTEIIAEEYVTASTTGQLLLNATGFSGFMRNVEVYAADAADVGAPYFLWATGASAFTGANPVTDYPLELHWSGANQSGFGGAVSVLEDYTNLKGVTESTCYDWQGGNSNAYTTFVEGVRMMRSGWFDAINHGYSTNLIAGSPAAHGHTFGTLGTVAIGKLRLGDGYFNGRLCKAAITAGTNAGGQAAIEGQFGGADVMICWGDSMTAGNGRDDTWPLYLRSRIGIDTENKGAGGETSTQIRTRFVAENSHKREWINVFWMGTNDSPHVNGWAATLANIAACVADLNGDQRFLVLGVTVADGSVPPSYVDDLDVTLAGLYGERFVDIRAYLQSYGDGSANDNADIAVGLVPRSLRSDTIHLNGRGKQIVVKCLSEKLAALGWV